MNLAIWVTLVEKHVELYSLEVLQNGMNFSTNLF